MVKLNKIYTKTGDHGETMLGDGARVAKESPRVEAYGDVDEANSAIGVAIAETEGVDSEAAGEIRAILVHVQNDLFDVGADLCAPMSHQEKDGERLRVSDHQVEHLEQEIDRLNKDLAPLESFVLPGGSPLSASLHLARTICRRAERRVATLLHGEPGRTNPLAMIYLNRLSDLLFVMARVANDSGKKDALWKPGEHR